MTPVLARVAAWPRVSAGPKFGHIPKPLPPIDLSAPGATLDDPELHAAPGHIVVLSGPSGVGKGTGKAGILSYPSLAKDLVVIKSYKTRALRPGEEGQDSDSIRVPVEQFKAMAADRQLFQFVEYAGNMYGSALNDVKDALQKGKIAFLEMTAEFALQIKKRYGNKATIIFLAPPDKHALLERLQKRNTEDELTIQRRVAHADAELALQPYFDHVVVSERGGIPKLIDDLKTIFTRIQSGLPKAS